MNAIEITGLTKSYKNDEALRGLDLRIPRGALCGFVGLNGAGKTTTLRILLGMARADGGTVRLLDSTPADAEVRRRIGFVPEKKELFPYMKVGDVVAFTKSFYPKWREDLEREYQSAFGLDYRRGVGELSKGNLTKLQLLLSLCRDAELLLLDEPTDGLDPVATEVALQALVRTVAENGTTVVFCTHRLNEVEQIADHLSLIHLGKTLLDEPIEDLKARCRRVAAVFENDPPARVWAPFGPVRTAGRSMTVLVKDDAERAAEAARGAGALSVEMQPVALREIFLELVRGGGDQVGGRDDLA